MVSAFTAMVLGSIPGQETKIPQAVRCPPPKKKQNKQTKTTFKKKRLNFPGGTVDKNLPANAGDTGLIPGPMLQGN